MVLLKTLINNIDEKFIKPNNLKFINDPYFIIKIKETVKDFFPRLNEIDIDTLNILTIFIVDHISFKYCFKQKPDYYLQWLQNNCSDIKGVILLLLPFIEDKDNSLLLKELTDLNHLIYSKTKDHITNDILNLNRDDILPTHFKYGNMGIGLLPFTSSENSDRLLDLYPQTEKKIYQVMIDNFYGLLQTLDIINGKSYINWINIQPLNLKTYNTTELYIKTKEQINLISGKFLSTINIDYCGLWFGDIYNVIRIKYYEEVKKIKWLFFPYEKSQDDNAYLINILHEMINLEDIINNEFNNYDELYEKDKVKFYNNITSNITNSDVIKYTLIWFINNYSQKDKIVGDIIDIFKLLNPDEEKQDDFDDKDLRKINNITLDEITKCYQYISENYCGHFWNFLRESIKLLIHSTYGKFLIIKDTDNNLRINNNYYYTPFNEKINNKVLNLKIIYNISKSLCHSKDWVLLDKYYISLDTTNRINFFRKIKNLSNNTNRWFNYSRNYKRQHLYIPSPPDNQIIQFEKDALKEFKNILINLVFEELITTGILNEFVPKLHITDKQRLSPNTLVLKKQRNSLIKKMFSDNKSVWDECFYYLTNDKFKYIPKMRKKKNEVTDQSDKYDEKDYFEMISDDQDWPNFYAMNWISQISFFQHYIFHQIMYVTGATGQGKSTQVPKLLLYVCKMYDYNKSGNIICTQPRITPTVDNATRIAEELGLPIEQVSNTSSTKIKTDNFNVQYKYEGDGHTKTCPNELVLKIVTDGTLKETLISNPTLKTMDNKSNEFINQNMYDIIIVDEAHEHNINMDIIIALSKQTCYFNNQVKLIIVSATMDADEPIYRSYFKNINDNLVYPIKAKIMEPFFNEQILFNPVHMDRRYHISPPGETTQYKVTEIYLDYDVKEINNKKTADKIQELGYKQIIEICNKSTLGEILFFCTGKNEILKAIEYLNNNMPSGNIALPFFADLNQKYKDTITKINSNIYNIKNKRENIHLEWGSNYIEDLSVPNGLYKRAIIIATNVAEASVTIPGLMYVIDNGYAKETTYDRKLNISKLITDKISESSRVQRRGRVGRVSDGTVYYMYTKGARTNIKPKYKITQQDITETVLGLSYSLDLKAYLKDPIEYKYNKLIVSDIMDPNIVGIINKSKYNVKKSFTYKKLLKIYEANYTINQKLLDNSYYLIKNINNNNNKVSINKSLYVYDGGQLFENMMDGLGIFYLIHPYENLIKRNIINEINGIKNNEEHFKKTNHIPLTEFSFFIKSLIDKNLIVDINADSLYLYLDDIIKRNRNFVKSDLADKALEIKKDLDLTTLQIAITLIAASSMGCLQQVLQIQMFLDLLNNSIGNLVNDNKKWEEFKQLHRCRKNDSDIIFIHNIINKIKSRFNKLIVFNIDNINNNITTKLNKYIEREINDFKDLEKKSKDPPSNYDGEIWNKLMNLKNNGRINTNNMQDFAKIYTKQTKTFDFIFNDIENYIEEIKHWSESNYLNPTIIISFIKKLGLFYLNKQDEYNKNKVIIWSKKFRSNFDKCLTDYTQEERILRSYLYGYPNQITFDESNNIKTNMNFSLYNVTYAKSYKSKKRAIETMSATSDMMFYLKFEEDDTNINTIKVSILNNINSKWLISTQPLVYNPSFNNIMQDVKDNQTIISLFDSYTINKLSNEISNNWSNDYFVWNTSDAPILQHFYKSIINVINKLTR